MSSAKVRNSGEGKILFAEQTETNFPSYRPNVFTISNDLAIADRASLVRNDVNPPQPPLANDTQSFARQSLEKGGRVCNDETTLVPQYLSALVPSKRAAFTLAEVLITLGIIGVVAAITIPAIQAKYFEKMVVAKVKQTYSILGNAVNMMISEQGCGISSCYSTVSAPDIETIAGWVDKYFKYTEKNCVSVNGSKKAISWLPEFGYTLDGQKTNNPILSVAYNYSNHLNSNVCFYKLNNGVNLAITRHNTFDPNGGSVLYFVMDANGKQGPNRVGKDVFVFTSSSSSYSSSRNHALSGEFALHAWSSVSMAGGMCYTTWSYIKKECPLDEKTPTLYVLTYGKLPNLTP